MNVSSLEKKIHKKYAYGVDYDIAHPAFSKRDEGLMVLIGDGIEYTDNSRNYKCFTGSHNCEKSPKEEKIKDCIFSNMGTFFNKKIEGTKV
ncbi:MAG: hypothetical protein H6Q53_1875 [Deltaproteobacteria bacterium]|jgi:hypothetical protein|nr:hypothetical protein [Deltaproteobacteria bacterium]